MLYSWLDILHRQYIDVVFGYTMAEWCCCKRMADGTWSNDIALCSQVRWHKWCVL